MEENPEQRADVEMSVPPVVGPGYTYASVGQKISSIVLTRKTPTGWFVGLAICALLVLVLLVSNRS